MQRIATVLAGLLLVMAGCTQARDDPAPGDDGQVAGGGNGGQGDGQGGGSDANASWVPALTADRLNGTAPLNITFTVDAPGAQNASWSLDFGDGNGTQGTAVPADAWHVFAAGNHSVTLTVDADGVSQAVSVLVVAVAGAPAPVVDAYTAKVAVGAPWLLYDPSGAAPALDMEAFAWASYDAEAPNAHGHAFSVPADATRLEIASAQLDATGGATHPAEAVCDEGDPVAPDTDMFLFKGDGTYVADSGSCGTGESIALVGPEPGDYVIVQLGLLGADMEIPTTITISFA